MASILGDGTDPGGSGPSRCLLLLQRSLAIQLTRGPPPQVLNASQRESPKEHPADEMWMYDKGYNLFQVSIIPSITRIPFRILSDSTFILCHNSTPFMGYERYLRLREGVIWLDDGDVRLHRLICSIEICFWEHGQITDDNVLKFILQGIVISLKRLHY